MGSSLKEFHVFTSKNKSMPSPPPTPTQHRGGKKKKSQQKMDREARLSRPQIKRLALIKMLRNTSMWTWRRDKKESPEIGYTFK